MRRVSAVFFLLVAVAGCRDSADAMSRFYRSVNNEALDALMMITSDSICKDMMERILLEYPDRIHGPAPRGVEARVKVWKQNNEKDDYGAQLLTSDSVVILLIENSINQKRLAMEESRLRALMN